MKTIKILGFLLLFSILKVSAQQISNAEIQVTGLTCSMCSQATEKSLKTLDFMSAIKPDLNKNLFFLSFRKEKNVNLDMVKNKVEDAGFSLGSMVVTINFDNVKVDENGQANVNGNIYRFENVKNKTLNGPTRVTVIDKNFVSAAVFKKKSAALNSEAYKTGVAVINGKKTRVYHLSV